MQTSLVFEVHFVHRSKYDGTLLSRERSRAMGMGFEVEIIAADSHPRQVGILYLRAVTL